VLSIELGVAPQAGVHSFWGWATSAYEVVPIYIDHHATGGIGNAARGKGSDEATLGAIEVTRI
jgi:hypothetical protein